MAGLIGLIAMLPARVGYHTFLEPHIPVSGIEGTIWRGTAAETSINGVYLRDIEWKLHPLAILTGKLAYAVSASSVSGFLVSDVSVGAGGSLAVKELTAALPLSPFAGPLGVSGLDGTAQLKFERAEFQDGFVTAADGTLNVMNLVVPQLGRESLGGFAAEFYTQNSGISASVEDADAVVDLAGSLQIKTDRSFEFDAQVLPITSTPQNIRQQLRLLPPPNDRGQYEIRLAGVF